MKVDGDENRSRRGKRSSDDGKTNLREGTLGEDTIIEKQHGQRLSIDPSNRKTDSLRKHSHQKTSLTTGTITNDDELATNLGHLVEKKSSVSEINQEIRTDDENKW